MPATLGLHIGVKVNPGGHMRIGELAERTGVSTRLLRYYEEQGLLTASRDTNGYRAYDEDAVVRVRQIRRLLGVGLTTEVIGSALRCASGEDAHLDLCPELAGLLHRELTAMDDRIGVLQRRRTALAGYLRGEGTADRRTARSIR